MQTGKTGCRPRQTPNQHSVGACGDHVLLHSYHCRFMTSFQAFRKKFRALLSEETFHCRQVLIFSVLFYLTTTTDKTLYVIATQVYYKSSLWRLLVQDIFQTGCPSCHPTNSVKALKGWCISTQGRQCESTAKLICIDNMCLLGYWHQRADERHGKPPPKATRSY